MKKSIRYKTIALATTLLALVPTMWAAPLPQTGGMGKGGGMEHGQASILGDLTKDWQRQEKTMIAIADAMPEDKFSYKTTPPQRNYGEQVVHVAVVNVQLLKLLGGKAAAPSVSMDDAKTKASALKALTDSYDYGTALLKEQTEESIAQTISAPAFLGPSTRARIVWFLMSHSMDIYGQMVVYLRLNGIVPPASRKDMP